ncbi:hypothetical protein AGOR_G00212150 [Albula goreensis]|uniref:Ig-like domain-containing protein n=1 Tax=Albula goreensis TaxID=1534307 RepID=A0A8T3CM94_9TELE|nr:hypothetical protein AGOR_G00212150 [Albula goreensis]
MSAETEHSCTQVLSRLLFPGLSAVEVRPSRNPIPAGENVTLEVIPPTAMQLGTWSFESLTILIYSTETETVIPEYLHRLAFDSNTGSLTLMNVNVNDSGLYIIQGFQPSFRAEVTLSVQEPVSDVTVNASATDLVEFNDTVTLTCSASGSSLSFQWLLGSSDIITGGRVQLSDDGSILTISSVLRSDRGPLYCIAYNGISNGTSQPILLNISFGPGDPEVTKNPNEAIYRAGSGVVLSCSAQSNPPASYLWEFDGRLLSPTGPELSLQNVHQNQSGNYSCLAHNSITRRYTRAQTSITILDPISGVIVKNSGELPILDKVFTLSCEVSGPASSIQWLKDGHALVPDNRTVFSADSGSVTLSPVQRSDDGSYQCEAFNAVSNKTSPGYHLLVNYGPEQVVITGPAVAETGTNVTFSCSASSQPPSQYRWYFNSSQVGAGSVFETGPLTLASHGLYTCKASNSVTGRNSTAVKELAVVAPITAAMVIVSGGLPIQDRPVTMECKVDGQADSIQWLRDGSPMMADNRTVFSADNSSVTLSPVQRSDDGSYQCEVFNAVSNKTSPGYHLLVNYGPEQVVITGPAVAATGTNATFSCSASSQPPSQYRWYFNGSQVGEGSVFETGPLTLANHGAYTCEASNSVTGRNSTAVKELAVIAIISLVTVNANPSQPILSQSVTLTCDITGAVSSIHWLKDGHALVPDNRMAFSSDNGSVTLSPVQRSDDGTYQCEAFNAVSNKTSPGYHLLVNYGPEQVVITGPAVAATGTNVTFSCSASSQPPSQYRWYFNGSQVAEGSVFETGPLTLASHGAYTCEASNSVTGGTALL